MAKLGKLDEALAKDPQKKLLKLLEEHGGGATRDEDISHEGTKFLIPANMTTKQAIKFLERHQLSQDERTDFSRVYQFRPWDGAAALQRALKKLMGTAGIPKPHMGGFFGQTEYPPELRTINTDVNETLQVPWGELEVPMLDATIETGGARDPDFGVLFRLSVNAPRKQAARIEGLFAVVEEELRSGSIYRGKVFDGRDMPQFIDLSKIDPRQAVYSEDVERELEASVWSLLKYTEKMRQLNVPLKRAVLLEGPFGSGKTLAAFVTATIAKEHGWTFIYCRPGRDDLHEVMATARLYQPSVVFFEDMDTIAEDPEHNELTKLLDLFDGITAKGTEILAMLTTNHKDLISKAMVRPGRLDAIVHVGAQDSKAVERMIRNSLSEDLLDPEIDYDAIGEAMRGFLPAFVKEVIDRTIRYAIVRTEGETPENLRTEDFVYAAHSLYSHKALLDAEVPEKPDRLMEAVGAAVRDATVGLELTNRGGRFILNKPPENNGK